MVPASLARSEQSSKSLANDAETMTEAKIIVVGRKLAMKMAGDPRVVLSIDGPNSTEEISEVAENLLHALEQMPANTL